MLLQCRDDFARYTIQCPPGSEVKRDEETDFLVIPDSEDPEVPFWLWDEILIEGARSGDFGLRLLSVDPFN